MAHSGSGPAADRADSGTERMRIMTTSATSNAVSVIVTGVFTAGGVDHVGTVDNLVFPRGTVQIRRSPATGKQSLNPPACLLTASLHRGHAMPFSESNPVAGQGEAAGLPGGRPAAPLPAACRRTGGSVPPAKNAGSRQRATSIRAAPISREPAPIRKMPPTPAKLEVLLDAGQYDLIDRTNAASSARPPTAGRMPLKSPRIEPAQRRARRPRQGMPGASFDECHHGEDAQRDQLDAE
jgi:hypothetical protein